MPNTVGYYLFSFNNPARKQRMIERFAKENIVPNFVKNVEITDPRLLEAPVTHKRNWAIMWNHLDMLKAFLESDNTYAVFCEDDTHIRKGLSSFMPEIIEAYNRRNLEILLLGYLITSPPAGLITYDGCYSYDVNLLYLTYSETQWGAHMYFLNRTTAEKFLKLYNESYAKATLNTILDNQPPPFSPDWTLTKNGRRALIYPMMGVEEGEVATTDKAQIDYHRACHKFTYDPKWYW